MVTNTNHIYDDKPINKDENNLQSCTAISFDSHVCIYTMQMLNLHCVIICISITISPLFF